ncbi:peptidoglycan editing factor PgeF [bacterium]|nr:peptidoglycan editing factor PgeF [bacterium]
MFYFDKIDGKKILKSDLITKANAFFTTKEICICDKTQFDESKNYKIQKSPVKIPISCDRDEILKQVQDDSKTVVQNDKIFAIEYNKKLIANYLKIEPENLIFPTQTHSANVDIAIENKFEYPDTDGLILTKNNFAIFLNFADCTPLIFYDEKQNIGAVSHAGWRGTAQKIAQITAQKLISEFGSSPQDICVLIGPAICGKCYEVGEEVYNNFSPSPLPPLPKGARECKIDLKEINRKQLADIGIEKIDICPYCTCCNNELFFSYRKENGTTLRHSAVLKLN